MNFLKLLIVSFVVVLLVDFSEESRGKNRGKMRRGRRRRKKNPVVQTEWLYATVVVEPNPNIADSNVQGTVHFRQMIMGMKASSTEYRVTLTGFDQNDSVQRHGSHIHTYGTITTGCEGAGGHYNPTNTTHALPNENTREIGDLANVEEDGDGNVNVTLMNSLISLTGKHSIMGRTWDVHANEDTGTGRSGNAGPRVACGVVVASDGSAWNN